MEPDAQSEPRSLVTVPVREPLEQQLAVERDVQLVTEGQAATFVHIDRLLGVRPAVGAQLEPAAAIVPLWRVAAFVLEGLEQREAVQRHVQHVTEGGYYISQQQTFAYIDRTPDVRVAVGAQLLMAYAVHPLSRTARNAIMDGVATSRIFRQCFVINGVGGRACTSCLFVQSRVCGIDVRGRRQHEVCIVCLRCEFHYGVLGTLLGWNRPRRVAIAAARRACDYMVRRRALQLISELNGGLPDGASLPPAIEL